MAVALKNFTFSLPPELVDRLKEHVKDYNMPSLNSAAREALEVYVKQLDREKLRQVMRNAVRDPQFMDDLNKSMQDFGLS